MKEYKIVNVSEGGLGTLLLGKSKVPIKKMEKIINTHAQEGYEVVFQILEERRMLLLWKRESVIITFARKI
jgi:hypothetical protein